MTDIEIRISERESGTLVERIVLHICYLPEKNGYELTVIPQETLKTYQD